MEKKSRLGLFGGTFNPIHLGHIHAGRVVQSRFRLDRVLFIPSSIPPHKETREMASAEDRFNMVSAAVAEIPGFVASSIEIEAPGTSYSIHTLDRIRDQYPDADLFFILGIDAFLEIDTWKDYAKVLERCFFIVISRPGYDLEKASSVLGGQLRGRMQELREDEEFDDSSLSQVSIFLLKIDALDIASSDIRKCLSSKMSISSKVSQPVREYIKEHRLYMTQPDSLPNEISLCVKAGQDKKAEDILVLDLRGLSSFTDYFVIMQGNSVRQNHALLESVELSLKNKNIRPLSVEGKKHGEWILMDYGSFIVHIFSSQTRAYYALEKLWGDGVKHTF